MRLRTLPALLLPVVLLAACGDAAGDAPDTTEAAEPTEAPTDDTVTETTVVETTVPPSPDKPEVEIPAAEPTELVVTVLQEGSGPEAVNGDTVIVDYVGVLSADGTEFDNSYDRGSPFPVTLGTGSVIQGWDEGLVGAQAGSRIQLDIPGDMAYGEAGSPPVIGPNAALTFVVDVRAVVPTSDPADAPLDAPVPSAEGVTELAVEDLVVGEGAEVAVGQPLYIPYLAYDSEGNLLQNSWDGGTPQELMYDPSAVALTGLFDGLEGMKVGGRRSLVIPASEGFGDTGNADLGIDPGESLIMIIDVLAVS